jgi:hypothetical protein
MGFTFPATGITLEIKESTYAALATREAPVGRSWSRVVAEMNIGGDFKEAISATWSLEHWHGRFW